MIRVKKENHRSWFMSNYYPCEFVMNGVVEHTKPMGNAYRDTIERALAARLKQPNDAPTSYEDYQTKAR